MEDAENLNGGIQEEAQLIAEEETEAEVDVDLLLNKNTLSTYPERVERALERLLQGKYIYTLRYTVL